MKTKEQKNLGPEQRGAFVSGSGWGSDAGRSFVALFWPRVMHVTNTVQRGHFGPQSVPINTQSDTSENPGSSCVTEDKDNFLFRSLRAVNRLFVRECPAAQNLQTY